MKFMVTYYIVNMERNPLRRFKLSKQKKSFLNTNPWLISESDLLLMYFGLVWDVQ